MIIPELEDAAKKFPGFGNNSKIWTPDEEDTLTRYYGKVPTVLLAKYIPQHTRNSFRRKLYSIKRKEARKRIVSESTEPAPAPAKAKPETTLKKIQKMAKKESCAKNASAPRWTEPEKEIIKNHVNDPGFTVAWKEYQEKFPGQRNETAVYMKWYAYKQQGKKDKPEPGKKGASTETGNRYSNKWNIPIDSVKEPAKYEYARKICKRFGKPYPEALKLKEAADAAERQKKPEKVEERTPEPKKAKDTGVEKKVKKTGHRIPCPFCKKECNSHGMHLHVKHKHSDKYGEWSKTPDRLQQGIHKSVHQKNDKKSVDKASLIVTGLKVRQKTPVDGKMLFGTAMVTHRDGDLVTVNNGNGKKHVIDVRHLEVATGPEKVSPVPEHGRFRDEENPEEMLSPPPEKAAESSQNDPGPAPARHITRGDKVRHITAYPLFPGVGTVVKTSTNGKEVMVDFGNGTEWLDRKNLELVPLEAKA